MLSCNKNNHPKVNFCLQKEKFAPLLHLPIRHIQVLRELLTTCRSGFDESWLAPFDTTLYFEKYDFEMESQIQNLHTFPSGKWSKKIVLSPELCPIKMN